LKTKEKQFNFLTAVVISGALVAKKVVKLISTIFQLLSRARIFAIEASALQNCWPTQPGNPKHQCIKQCQISFHKVQ